ncbi:hypothetical protein DIPPA_34083 [Diplonema papillatum]|nr:hypothetical protein DIPPA_34083 [Diplonema papillatum]
MKAGDRVSMCGQWLIDGDGNWRENPSKPRTKAPQRGGSDAGGRAGLMIQACAVGRRADGQKAPRQPPSRLSQKRASSFHRPLTKQHARAAAAPLVLIGGSCSLPPL